MNTIKVICENNRRPVLKKRMRLCACAKSPDLLKVPKGLNAVFLADVDLPYWTSKVEHIAAFTAIFGNICTAHAQKRLFLNFRCKFRHRHSTRRPRFPIRVQNFVDLATFSVDFCILYSECPPYFYFRFVWRTDLESIPHASTPTKFEAPTPIRSWVMSDNVSHWLPLKMRTLPLRMRRITWPVSRGQQQLHFWNPRVS